MCASEDSCVKLYELRIKVQKRRSRVLTRLRRGGLADDSSLTNVPDRGVGCRCIPAPAKAGSRVSRSEALAFVRTVP